MNARIFSIWLVEDNLALAKALCKGLESTGQVRVLASFTRGEAVVGARPTEPPAAVLMDVALAGEINGIQAAIGLRKEYPRLPVVFYSIQDDENYYRAFLRSGVLTHYAYVRKSNYLLPESIVPLLRDAISGRSTIDPEIEARVQAVRRKDENDPLALLEPNEQAVAGLVAQGLTNEQIAARLGFRDKRTISRTNGQIYAAWGLDINTTDEKVARTRAALIVNSGRFLTWDSQGAAYILDERGQQVPWDGT